MITHDLETIDGIADRAVMLQNGRLDAIPDGPRSAARALPRGHERRGERTVRQ